MVGRPRIGCPNFRFSQDVMTHLIAIAGASFLVTFLAIIALRPLAYAVDLIDRPGGHKTHHGDIPLMGGLAMFLGIVFGLAISGGGFAEINYLLVSATMLIVVGLLDDRFNLSPWIRLVVQFGATLPMMLGAGVLVTSIGSPFGSGEVQLGAAAYPFTALLIMSSINAFNMLDGMDGLAGGVALSAFIFLASVASISGNGLAVSQSSVMIGAVVAFLVFNAPLKFNESIRCFMGDAGSTILGFLVALLCIELTQGPKALVQPVTALWLVAWPLFELLWSTLRRLLAGRSPFRADNQHFHHVLTAAGFGVRSIFGIAIGSSILFAGTGLAAAQAGVPEAVSLVVLAVVGVGTVYLIQHARSFLRYLPPAYRRKIPPLEAESGVGESGTP
ncbi:MAG: undecaprenyl/decaprenyl-phosphate alpha-N-acetylglucosaminyl 1-phosphate transferase [Gammaproteobacteria bacterium]|nr:undecaprenyl/decaprenyl-phosphate alpha-N-acetylglucosaminyl 1-phosphate transferase [Gammaproteobacteria bacterium]